MVNDVYQTKNSRLNNTTFKKKFVPQQIPKNPIFNSSMKVLKGSKARQQQQSIVTVKRNVKSVKLPTIVRKKPSPTIPSISPAYIPHSSKVQIAASNVIHQPPPPPPPKLLKPIIVLPQLPSIKDHVIKQNLTQKPALKCKSPRPGSMFSRSNTFVAVEPEEQTKSHQPLQGMDVGCLLSESARHRLKRLFHKLDTDKDGHLLYPQVQRCLPPNLPHAQMTFFRVLYDIISGTTFFGLQEFYATAIIVELVAKQDLTLWNTFLDDVDFNYYHDNILELLGEFNSQCLLDTGTINYENLLKLIMKRRTNDKKERITHELEYVMPKIQTMKINRLDFIALLPAIIYIESCFDHGPVLFRFRENSVLDLHMRRALIT